MESYRFALHDVSGTLSRRLSLTALACALVWASPGTLVGQRGLEQVSVFSPRGKQAIAISLFAGGVAMLPLDELAPLVGGSIRAETDRATFEIGERRVAIYSGRSLVLLGDGATKLLSDPVTVRAGRWFVPLDFLQKILPSLMDEKVTYRENERLLVLGKGFPKLRIRTMTYPAYTRVVMESSSSVGFQVNQTTAQVQVLIQAPYIESTFRRQQIRDGVVEEMRLERLSDGYVLSVGLGERFGTLKAFELENPKRLVIDFFRSRVPAEAVPETGRIEPAEPPIVPATPPEPERGDLERPTSGELQIVTLDPGHGGAETGAEGPGGLMEKEVTLSIARRLRGLLENRLGLRVVLTRDGDRNLALDERTAIANNNKSDLFISIHANASPRRNAKGSSVYFLSYEASDEESRRVAAAENAPTAHVPVAEDRDLQFILWDMAQAAYLNESAILAEILQQELLGGTGGKNNRGIKQAPFRVLMGAIMPAVLVEVAFITNPKEEKNLRTDAFQEQVAEAIYRGVVRYKERWEKRLGTGRTHSSRGVR